MPKLKHKSKIKTKKNPIQKPLTYPCKCGNLTNMEGAVVCNECISASLDQCFDCKEPFTSIKRTYIIYAWDPERKYVNEGIENKEEREKEENKIELIYYAYQSNPWREEARKKRDYTKYAASTWWSAEQTRVLPYCVSCAMKLPCLKFWASNNEGCDKNYTPITKQEQLKLY